MKKSLKTIEIAEAYQLIEGASYQSLSDEDKLKLWKVSRVLKPVATQFLSDKDDAMRSFITPEFIENFKKIRKYDADKDAGKTTEITYEEYMTRGKSVVEANNLMEKAIGEHADKEVEIEFEPLSEDALGPLITSNGWEFSKAEVLEWLTAKEV